MTEKEFYDKYCHLCGSQRCGGVFDEDMRDGCSHYQKEILGQQTLRELLEEINWKTRRPQAEPNTEGYWIKEYLGYGTYRYKCSQCGSIFGQSMIEDFHHDKYCADCGKKMKSRK